MEEEEEGGVDEDDLIAFADLPLGAQQEQQQEPGGPARSVPPPSKFASMSLGLSRGALALHRAFHQLALRAPLRRSLTRPSCAPRR